MVQGRRGPANKARRPSISSICKGGATQLAGMHRRPNAAGVSPRAASEAPPQTAEGQKGGPWRIFVTRIRPALIVAVATLWCAAVARAQSPAYGVGRPPIADELKAIDIEVLPD